MILKLLRLKNFRKFKDVTIDFPDGITGVVGLNGVGKSTIFEAIAWILYGTVAARTSAEQIKRDNAISTDSCRGELEFSFEEANYRVVREMRGKSLTSTATATVNGKVAATSAETVTKFVQKKLGMDFKSFFTSIFAKQKELNVLSTMNASERRPLILRMLGIDSLDDVIKQIKSDKREKDGIVERLNQDLTDELGRNRTVIFTLEIKTLEKQQEENQVFIKEIDKKIYQENKQLVNLEKNYQTSKNDYEKIKDKKEDLIKKKSLFDEKKKLEKEIILLKDKISVRQKNIDINNKKISNFLNIEDDIKSTENRLKVLDGKIKDLVKKIEQKKTLILSIKEKIYEISTKEIEIKGIGSDAKCPTCERVLAGQYNLLLRNFKDEKIKNQEKIDSFSKDLKDLNEENNKIVREQSALQKKSSYLQIKFREKEKISTTIKNISEELKDEKVELNNKQERFDDIKGVRFDEKEFDSISLKIKDSYDNYQNMLKLLNSKKEELNELKLDLERKKSTKKLISQKIEGFKNSISELEKSKKRIKEERVISQHLGLLSDVMSDFRTHLISRIRPTLSSYSSDFFERLTDGKYSELELDENYNLLVYDNGSPFRIERFSGGEEDLVNLCLRLAISEVITERAGGAFNFIILDEIFGSQDVFRRQNIMKALNSLSSKFRQIFLITHVDDVKNYMENIIFVSENENGISFAKVE